MYIRIHKNQDWEYKGGRAVTLTASTNVGSVGGGMRGRLWERANWRQDERERGGRGEFSCRVSHLPWNIHKYSNDASLATQRTQHILCCSFFLIFLLQVSSLHYLASWPRNILLPCMLLPCFMLLAGQDSLHVRNHQWTCELRCTNFREN